MSSTIAQHELSDDDLEAMKEAFAVFDTNGDGAVDADELEAGFESFIAKRRRSSVMRMIGGVVKNNEKQVDFEEFVILMKESETDGVVDKMLVNVDQTKKKTDLDIKKETQELKKRAGRKRLSQDDISSAVLGNLSAALQIDETPEFLNSKIELLDSEIIMLDDDMKKNWLLAREKMPEMFDDKQKLMFLRAELFDTQKAIIRWCAHWNFAIDLFGPEKAFLPLTLKDAMEGDEKYLQMPFFVDTGQYDEHDQQVVFCDMRVDDKDNDPRAMARAVFYFMMTLIEREEKAQMKGITFLTYCPTLSVWNMGQPI